MIFAEIREIGKCSGARLSFTKGVSHGCSFERRPRSQASAFEVHVEDGEIAQPGTKC
jgi:hypothetical protein